MTRKNRIEIERLIANDLEDCRGLTFTLINNGYVVWMEKIFDAEANKTNVIICYTKQNSMLRIYSQEELTSTVPFRIHDLCDKDEYCFRNKGHSGPCIDEDGNKIDYDAQLEEFEKTTMNAEDKEIEMSNSCPVCRNGCPCCLPRGHEGMHTYKCADPNCPGYPYPASESPHATCKE